MVGRLRMYHLSKPYDDDKGPDYEYNVLGLLTKCLWARFLTSQ